MKILSKSESFDAIKSESFEKKIFLQFSASWCGPCKVYMGNISKIENDFSNEYIFYKIDIEDHPKLTKDFMIRSVPQTAIIQNGEVLEQFVGMKSIDDLKVILK